MNHGEQKVGEYVRAHAMACFSDAEKKNAAEKDLLQSAREEPRRKRAEETR